MKILYKGYYISYRDSKNFMIKRASDDMFIVWCSTMLEAYQTIDYLDKSEFIPEEFDPADEF